MKRGDLLLQFDQLAAVHLVFFSIGDFLLRFLEAIGKFLVGRADFLEFVDPCLPVGELFFQIRFRLGEILLDLFAVGGGLREFLPLRFFQRLFLFLKLASHLVALGLEFGEFRFVVLEPLLPFERLVALARHCLPVIVHSRQRFHRSLDVVGGPPEFPGDALVFREKRFVVGLEFRYASGEFVDFRSVGFRCGCLGAVPVGLRRLQFRPRFREFGSRRHHLGLVFFDLHAGTRQFAPEPGEFTLEFGNPPFGSGQFTLELDRLWIFRRQWRHNH